jgi:hypothetical protein
MKARHVNMIILGLTVLSVVYLGLFSSTLDDAQAKFEITDDRARGFNWPVFRQSKSIAKLKCRDVSVNLRICDVSVPSIDPITGDRGALIHEPFACNRTGCGWLSE